MIIVADDVQRLKAEIEARFEAVWNKIDELEREVKALKNEI